MGFKAWDMPLLVLSEDALGEAGDREEEQEAAPNPPPFLPPLSAGFTATGSEHHHQIYDLGERKEEKEGKRKKEGGAFKGKGKGLRRRLPTHCRCWIFIGRGRCIKIKVKGPSGEQIHDSRDKISEKFEFRVPKKGLHSFCFTNKSPYHETVDFDVHVGHFSHFDRHVKDEHFLPLLEQTGKLEEALYYIQFEQHFLEAQTDRQAVVNKGMSRRAMHKALLESAALIGTSVLQVCLLYRLFERKLGTSRV